MQSHSAEPFSCYLIGADTLLMQCAELLLAQGHEIRGIVTPTPRVSRWARERQIPVLDPAGDYRSAMAERPFDYLFAITHLAIVEEEVLALPSRGAINFHDAPLPQYAGLNTPAWALMRGDTQYGVTWHLMTSEVDRGDILKQRRFDLSADETSLSLNAKCFEVGIESFGELIGELSGGALGPVPQGSAPAAYFGRHDRPDALSLLDLRKSAAELERQVRALYFGPYPNPLGAAKVECGRAAVMVTRAEARPDQADGEPGTVHQLTDSELVVATGEGTLALLGLASLEGEELSPAAAAERLGAAQGSQLTVRPDDERTRLTEIGRRLGRAEGAWRRRLDQLEPVEIPFAGDAGVADPEPRWVTRSEAIPGSFRERFGGDGLEDAAIAGALAWLGRLGGKDAFDVAFRDPALAELTQGLEHLLASHVPLRVDLPAHGSFRDLRERLGAELSTARKRKSFLRDLIGREPELSARPELRRGRLLPVALVQAASAAELEAGPGSLLTIGVAGDQIHVVYDPSRLGQDAAAAIDKGIRGFLARLAEAADEPLGSIELLDDDERRRVVHEWNATATDYPRDATIGGLFEAQVDRAPDRTALVSEGSRLTYRELDSRANRLAHHLRSLGVRPDTLVGVCVERSLDLMVATLGVHKAGGAYVPLDPSYPADRIAWMVEDSRVPVVVTQAHLEQEIPHEGHEVVRIDADWAEIEKQPSTRPASGATAENLAYVIYTSGSTGRPKGVMVEHRNVVNFFVGMDERIPHDPPGTWLAVTSLSFDISVLELFWTLTRGFEVVVYRDRERDVREEQFPAEVQNRPMGFGLFYWGNDDGQGPRKYELLLEGAKFADRNGFTSLWTPERHFHAFGGPYPNPAVTGAAVAAVTRNLAIRAGSCVVPLHHPIRVAEEWAVIDNLSNGRVGLSMAAGWQPDDFVLRPENAPPNNKAAMLKDIDTVRRLWRGEKVSFESAGGKAIEVVTQPRPVQQELPVWVTTAGNPETYRQAAQAGANVLTHLLGQSIKDVGEKIGIYRDELEKSGRDRDSGKVTLMLHSFVGADRDEVRELVRGPMKDYLRSAAGLIKQYAWAFPAFKRPEGVEKPMDIDLQGVSEEDMDAILEFAFERYFEASGLFGTIEDCVQRVNELKAIGVDEIACLIDYGVPTSQVLEMLRPLSEVVRRTNVKVVEQPAAAEDPSLPGQIRQHGVTHMQCTPSMARMALGMPGSREALGTIQHLMVGGEALPSGLARELAEVVPGTVTNMYGPTETTIWSSTWRVEQPGDTIPIGTPVANTQLYVLDRHWRPVPPGVPGELWIGGDGVVRGYFERPELTAERFVPDPFQADGARMYRTGDLARWRGDGVLEFLGRTDHQVKIRGYRIELGEIETLLAQHPAVHEAVVVAREDTPGDQRLVGYVVPEGESPDAASLRTHLRDKLPDYMVPAQIISLDALPLTPNGKIDRKALPAPDSVQGPSEADYVPPEGELQQTVATVWMETLGHKQVGIDDNFFDLGGHSLLVVQMQRMLKERLEQPVSLTDLYRFPTIRAFADHLSSDGSAAQLEQSASRAQARRAAMQRRRRAR